MAVAALATASIAAAAALLASAATALAQQGQTTLPEVVVTAPAAPPPPPPPPSATAPTFGMLGKVRVEETKWPEIPCGSSRMNASAAAVAAPGKCQDGPKVMSFMSYGGSGLAPAGYGDCTIVHPLISAVIGRFAVEADMLVFDPYKVTAVPANSKCTVWTGFEHLPDDFKDMNQVARRGVGWRNFVAGNGQSGAQSTIQFSDGADSCLAVERLGPPWHGGFVWVMHATMCEPGTPAAAIQPADVDGVVSALQIHIYDPVGNLAPPPQPRY